MRGLTENDIYSLTEHDRFICSNDRNLGPDLFSWTRHPSATVLAAGLPSEENYSFDMLTRE